MEEHGSGEGGEVEGQRQRSARRGGGEGWVRGRLAVERVDGSVKHRKRVGGLRAVGVASDVGVAELAAGGHEVSAVGDAALGEDAFGFERVDEGADGVFGGGFVGGEALGVVGDDVDDAGEVFAEGGDGFGVGGGVVGVFDEDVFDEEAGARGEGVGFEGFFQGGEGHGLVDGHEGVAEVVVGGVEADGEAKVFEGRFGVAEGREFFDAVDAANGGDGDLGEGEVEAVGFGEDTEGLEEVVEVVERFAHAHEDDVLDAVGEV